MRQHDARGSAGVRGDLGISEGAWGVGIVAISEWG
jgi:hypothetical protein